MRMTEQAAASVNPPPTVREAAVHEGADVLTMLSCTPDGLATAEAEARRARVGRNVLRERRARPWRVLGRQVKSPILILLFVTAAVSMFLGETANAVIIGIILAASIGLGFVSEYRAERTADALHDRIRHTVIARRGGAPMEIDVTDLVPGDIVALSTGTVVPADMRLLEAHNLACDESIVTGESVPTTKSTQPAERNAGIADFTSCVLMGTVVQSGTGTAVVVATGARTEFGRIAAGLATAQTQTEFQRGLGRFSMLLLEVALTLTTVVFVANVLLHRPVLDALLFSLAIAVGITPQLLPAVVSTSLAAGSRALAKRRVLVKRLVCIEDLGDMDILVTDKTGTLTEGRISFTRALPADPTTDPGALQLLGLLATEADYTTTPQTVVGLNALDAALWDAARPASARLETYRRVDLLAFDHERRRTTVLADTPAGERIVVTKGSPEEVMGACSHVPVGAQAILDGEYADGARVVAVATKPAPHLQTLTVGDENNLSLVGFLVFLDRPKPDARASLDELARLGITVKVATGDNAVVAQKVLADLGFVSGGTLTSRTSSSSGVGSVSIDHVDGMKNRTVHPPSALPVWATGAVMAIFSAERCWLTGAVIAISVLRWLPPKI